QALPIDVDAGGEAVVLGLVVDGVEGGEVAAGQAHRAAARLGRERYDGPAVGVARVLRVRHPHDGVRHRLVRLVDHGDDLPGGPGGDHGTQPALPHQSAA